MANSDDGIEGYKDTVVNCFQISNFVLWQTAEQQTSVTDKEL